MMTHGPDSSTGRQWREDGVAHIDVRGLVPPQPLVAIMRLLTSLEQGTAVIAHLDRDPVMLYPELERIGWQAETLLADEGEVRLRLRRAA
jgi:hypothetical protein